MALKLIADLVLDGKGFDAGLNKAKSSAGKARQAIGGAFKSIGAAIMGAFAIGAIKKQVMAAIEYATKIRDLGNTFGVSTDAVQQFDYAARQSGQSVETVMDAMRDLGKNTAEALQGSTNKLWAFEQLGVDAEKIKSMKLEDIFKQIARNVNAMDGMLSPEQAKAFEELMGGSGFNLINMMRNDLDAMMNEASDSGMIMSEEDVKLLGLAGDKLEAVKQKAMIMFAPVAEFWADKFLWLFEFVKTGYDKLIERGARIMAAFPNSWNPFDWAKALPKILTETAGGFTDIVESTLEASVNVDKIRRDLLAAAKASDFLNPEQAAAIKKEIESKKKLTEEIQKLENARMTQVEKLAAAEEQLAKARADLLAAQEPAGLDKVDAVAAEAREKLFEAQEAFNEIAEGNIGADDLAAAVRELEDAKAVQAVSQGRVDADQIDGADGMQASSAAARVAFEEFKDLHKRLDSLRTRMGEDSEIIDMGMLQSLAKEIGNAQTLLASAKEGGDILAIDAAKQELAMLQTQADNLREQHGESVYNEAMSVARGLAVMTRDMSAWEDMGAEGYNADRLAQADERVAVAEARLAALQKTSGARDVEKLIETTVELAEQERLARDYVRIQQEQITFEQQRLDALKLGGEEANKLAGNNIERAQADLDKARERFEKLKESEPARLAQQLDAAGKRLGAASARYQKARDMLDQGSINQRQFDFEQQRFDKERDRHQVTTAELNEGGTQETWFAEKDLESAMARLEQYRKGRDAQIKSLEESIALRESRLQALTQDTTTSELGVLQARKAVLEAENKVNQERAAMYGDNADAQRRALEYQIVDLQAHLAQIVVKYNEALAAYQKNSSNENKLKLEGLANEMNSVKDELTGLSDIKIDISRPELAIADLQQRLLSEQAKWQALLAERAQIDPEDEEALDANAEQVAAAYQNVMGTTGQLRTKRDEFMADKDPEQRLAYFKAIHSKELAEYQTQAAQLQEMINAKAAGADISEEQLNEMRDRVKNAYRDTREAGFMVSDTQAEVDEASAEEQKKLADEAAREDERIEDTLRSQNANRAADSLARIGLRRGALTPEIKIAEKQLHKTEEVVDVLTKCNRNLSVLRPEGGEQ